ncbi:unnamed protein product [Amoebophrya sp. A120]|nr:unnamed protein product [Amoebophrya sp. A120]|eukprot:GSA120T00022693001.1
MPLSAKFTWTEDLDTITFVVRIPGVKANKCVVVISPVYVKVNQSPHFFEQDLLHEVDLGGSQARVAPDRVTLLLKKRSPGTWGDFRYANSSATGGREALLARRKESLQKWEERERQLTEQRKDQRFQLNKKAEEEQWRLDREGREKIEKWKEEEKEIAENEVFDVLDNLGEKPKFGGPVERRKPGEEYRSTCSGSAGGSTSSIFRDDAPASAKIEEVPDSEEDEEEDLVDSDGENEPAPKVKAKKAENITDKNTDPEDNQKIEAAGARDEKDPDSEEEYQMEILPPKPHLPEVRQAGTHKMILPMTRHAKPGVPARDRPGRAPPHPRDLTGVAAPKQHKLAGETDYDESDPVWLKDKADKCMAAGDYPSAMQAYTTALTEYSNARAFANRAVCALYLGKLSNCIEDCNHAIKILNMKTKVPDGHCAPPKDPEDEKLRARVLVRRGVAFLWLGEYARCEDSFLTALDRNECEECALTKEERGILQEDLQRVRLAAKACEKKREIDKKLRTTNNVLDKETQAVILKEYDDAFLLEKEENAVVCANRSFVKLQAMDIEGCLQDADTTCDLLARWPVARNAPKLPEKPQRLDPPTLEDHTFRNPNASKTDEKDWLMKHHGSPNDGKLPDIPEEFEWVRDASEKKDEAWIAVRKKLTRDQITAIRAKITKFQEALYTRNIDVIDAAIETARQENLAKEGPCSEALHQAGEYRMKLSEYLDEQKKRAELDQEKMKEEDRTSTEFFERSLIATQPGCFRRDHPCEKTRRRLFVKTRLRQARAYELQEQFEDASKALEMVLSAEPKNPDALQLRAKIAGNLKKLGGKGEQEDEGTTAAGTSTSASGQLSATEAKNVERIIQKKILGGGGQNSSSAEDVEAKSRSRATAGGAKSAAVVEDSDSEDEDDPEDGSLQQAEVAKLVGTATKYLEKGEFESALQIFNYARTKGNFQLAAGPHQASASGAASSSGEDLFEEELRVRLNCCLCLQKLKRVQDLLKMCDETLRAIESRKPQSSHPRLEAACRTRRGWALHQLNRSAEATEEGKKAQALLRS